jgi:hypothetical protein
MSDQKPPLLFLSHAGIDTDAARALKARLLAASDAQAADCQSASKRGSGALSMMLGGSP